MTEPVHCTEGGRACGPGAGERVIVAMSGGVDSSLAAALLAERGCQVVGVRMQLLGNACDGRSLGDVADAR